MLTLLDSVHGRWKIRKTKESYRSNRSHIEKGESPSKASRVTLDHFTCDRRGTLPAAINSFTCERLTIKTTCEKIQVHLKYTRMDLLRTFPFFLSGVERFSHLRKKILIFFLLLFPISQTIYTYTRVRKTCERIPV